MTHIPEAADERYRLYIDLARQCEAETGQAHPLSGDIIRWQHAKIAALEAAAPHPPAPDAAVEAAVLAEALTALQACVDQLDQDTHMLYAEYAGSAQTTEAEKLARAVLARSASPKPGSGA